MTESENHKSNHLPNPQRNCAWFLDIDGTLLEFALTPDTVVVSEQLKSVLTRLEQACEGALALVSGRGISSIDSLFGSSIVAVAGQHGLERRDASGNIHYIAPPALPDSCMHQLSALEQSLPGVFVENKGGCSAVHYRRVPHFAEQVDAAVSNIANALGPDYELLRGNHVVEIKPNHYNKGTAIESFMEESPFVGRTPIFVGDDTTDGPGFNAVNHLDGISIVVGEKDLAATHRLPDVAAVIAWLGTITE